MSDRSKCEVGRVVLQLGGDISTDAIYPGRFMATVLPNETPQFAFADYTEFNSRLCNQDIPPGSVIVAGANFGCGSSREQAVSTLNGYGLIIVAKGFARIFLQNSVNLGLRTVTCPDIEASVGDELEIGPDGVMNRTTRRQFTVNALPPARQAVMNSGGLIAYTRKRLVESRTRG